MGSRRAKGEIATEIRKEYLKKHLDEVWNLADDWMHDLEAPGPLAPRAGAFGWHGIHVPIGEQTEDRNHMLRRHLRSRALWSHHANWSRRLDTVWRRVQQVRADANSAMLAGTGEERRYRDNFVATALWKGFDKAQGVEVGRLYSSLQNGVGVSYEGHTIDLSATNDAQRSAIEQEHWDSIDLAAELVPMRELVSAWGEVAESRDRILEIAGTALKSYDILYPCKFCKHLWK